MFAFGDSIVRISRAPERIGWELYEDLNSPFFYPVKLLFRRWYTRAVPLDRSRLMELEKNAQFLVALGLKDFQPGIPKIDRSFFPKNNSFGDYFVVVPDALWEGREWPLERFIEIARRVQAETKWKAVFMGTRNKLSSVLEAKGTGVDLINLIGRTGFMEYVKIVANSKFVIGNESSVIHLANAFGRPAFSITGGGHWGRFVPYKSDSPGPRPTLINVHMDCYGCEWLCPRGWTGGPAKCVEAVTLGQAWSVIYDFLQATRAGI
jgi:ADP-heptose:LPS heptosyltransferase